MTARPLQKLEQPTDWEAKCRALTQRDADRARRFDQATRDHAGQVLRLESTIRILERRVAAETELRLAAENNARGFHALLLQERIRKIGAGS